MKFLSNTYDPKRPDAPLYVTRQGDEDQAEAWLNHLFWLSDKVIGEPQVADVPNATSLDELKAMHMVGVYLP